MGEVRPLAGVDVDRERDRALARPPSRCSERRAGSSMRPSASIGSTVAGIRPFRSSVMSTLRGVVGVDSNRFLPAGEAPFRRCAARSPPVRSIIDQMRRSGMGQLDIFSLEGRVVLVAGGGGAIGAALAEAMAGAGARVVVTGRTADTLEAAVARSDRPAPRAWRSPGTPPARRTPIGSSRPRATPSGASTSSSTPSAAAPARCSTRPRRTRATRGTGSWSSTSGARSSRARPSPGR